MTYRTLGFALLSILASATSATSPTLGVAECSWSASDRSCELTWDFQHSPRAYYWVQQWEKGSQSWHSVDTPYSETLSSAVWSKHVEEGALYRVLACNDLDATKDCIGSTAYWSPYIPKTIDAALRIPERVTVHDRSGSHQTMVIDKNGDLASQTTQFNVYLLVQELEGADYRNLPPMTPPPNFDEANILNLTLEEIVHVNVYPNYSISRDRAISDKET